MPKKPTNPSQNQGLKILVIPDTQSKPGVPSAFFDWIARYIMEIMPDVILHIGDHFDMPSLSSYDKWKASIEGKRVRADIDYAHDTLAILDKYINKYNDVRRKRKEKLYSPRKIFCIGNHEQRIMRYVDSNPELVGFLSYDDLGLAELGWEVYDFLVPVEVAGIAFAHYFANPMTGKPYSGLPANMLKNIGTSFVMGHRQELAYATRSLYNGTSQLGIVAGACYQHDENYKGPQGNKHWRGLVVLNEARNGYADPMFVSLDYLQRKYSTKEK